MFQKKKKCGVCGYRFTPKKEEVYTAARSVKARRAGADLHIKEGSFQQ